MKKILVILFFISTSSYGNFNISAQGFGSQPLFKFCNENYSNGYGMELGLGYQFKLIKDYILELNGHFQFGENGEKITLLPVGHYILSNDFTNTHLEIKLRKEYPRYQPYIGIHAGTSRYHTDELLSYVDPNSKERKSYNEFIYSRKILQYGASIGTYFTITPNLYFNLSASLNIGGEAINFIDLTSISYENEVLDYKEKETIPVLLLVNFGLVVKIPSRQKNFYDYSSKGRTVTTGHRNEHVICEDVYVTPTKEKDHHAKPIKNQVKKQKTLIKKGKTPIGISQ